MRKKNRAQSWGISCERLCSLAPFLVVFEKHNLWAGEEEASGLGMAEHFQEKSWAISASTASRKWQRKHFTVPCPHTVGRDQQVYLWGYVGERLSQIWSQGYKHETNVSLKMSALSSRPAVCELGHAAWLHNIHCKKWSWLYSLPQPHQITLKIFTTADANTYG